MKLLSKEKKDQTCSMNKKRKSNRNICSGDKSIGSSVFFDKNVYSKDHEWPSKFLSKEEKEKAKDKLRTRISLEAEINQKLGEMHANGTLKRRGKLK